MPTKVTCKTEHMRHKQVSSPTHQVVNKQFASSKNKGETDFMKKFIIEKLLNISQRLVDYAYEKNGLTDKVLEKQLEINMLRSEHDIADKKMLNDNGYCQ